MLKPGHREGVTSGDLFSQFKKPMTLRGRKCAKESYFPAYNDFFFLLKTKHNLNFKSVLRFKIMPLKTAL